ncbi:MAG TPA: DUF1707 domain-containing protein [Longimicrobium sp.]|nr:DUF1707 domain-containing protein [Longimicrobium sp.]
MQPSPNVPLEQARQALIQHLAACYAADHLTEEALEERIDRAHHAATVQELRGLVADLPAVSAPHAVSAVPAAAPVARSIHTREQQTIVGIMGVAERKGPWSPARNVYVVAAMGGVDLDFREAHFGPGVTTVSILALMGAAEVIVPPGVHVEVDGSAILGGFGDASFGPPPTDPEAPVLRINGVAIMGGVDVSVRNPGETLRDAKRRMRAERKDRKRLQGG